MQRNKKKTIRRRAALFVVASFAAVVGVQFIRPVATGPESAAATVIAKPVFDPSVAPFVDAYRRPTSIPEPLDNLSNSDRVGLGHALFFDPRLSSSGIMSCATCHNPALSWGDGLPRGVGHGMNTLGRRTPTILNLAWVEPLMWDGRAGTLEEQALGPIESGAEMNLDLETLEKRVSSVPGYVAMFNKAYPGEGVNRKTIAKAIASFERTIVSGTAPFDRWLGGESQAMSESAQRGFVLFNTTANCNQCHSGWAFTDGSFHDVGVADDDIGRYKQLPLPSMKHAFKTPGLRNVAHRAPYMHDGSEPTLEDVVDLYAEGGRSKRESVSQMVQPLNLSAQDKADLVEFLKALSSRDTSVEIPVLPR